MDEEEELLAGVDDFSEEPPEDEEPEEDPEEELPESPELELEDEEVVVEDVPPPRESVR